MKSDDGDEYTRIELKASPGWCEPGQTSRWKIPLEL